MVEYLIMYIKDKKKTTLKSERQVLMQYMKICPQICATIVLDSNGQKEVGC